MTNASKEELCTRCGGKRIVSSGRPHMRDGHICFHCMGIGLEPQPPTTDNQASELDEILVELLPPMLQGVHKPLGRFSQPDEVTTTVDINASKRAKAKAAIQALLREARIEARLDEVAWFRTHAGKDTTPGYDPIINPDEYSYYMPIERLKRRYESLKAQLRKQSKKER